MRQRHRLTIGVDVVGLARSGAEAAGIVGSVGTGELQRATAESNRAGTSNRTGASEAQNAGVNDRATAVAVGARKGQRAAAGLGQRAGAGDRVAHGIGTGQVEHQRGAVGDAAAAELAAGAAIADLQSAGADGGKAAVGVGAGEGHSATAGFGDRAAAAGPLNDAGDGQLR